jgi:hypothetical protein
MVNYYLFFIYYYSLTAIEFSLGGNSPYASTDKESSERKIWKKDTDLNKGTSTRKWQMENKL